MQVLLPGENCFLFSGFSTPSDDKRNSHIAWKCAWECTCVQTWSSTTIPSSRTLPILSTTERHTPSPSHLLSLLSSVPLANADSGYTATTRTDKELTTPGRLACDERVTTVGWIYNSRDCGVYELFMEWSVFILTSPIFVFININSNRDNPLCAYP